MDPRFQTSFIPKKPITPATARPTSTVSLFSLLATVLFIVVLALSAGVFFYQNKLQKDIAVDKTSLDRAKGAFEPEVINQIIRLDTRIESAKTILASHLAVTPIFNLLSNATLKTVRFRDFSFSYIAPDKISINMKGQATGYSAVALESDTLNTQKALKNTMLSEMALEPLGTVSFNVSTTLDPSLVSYPNSISNISTTGSTTTP